jgi:hypothetical protein
VVELANWSQRSTALDPYLEEHGLAGSRLRRHVELFEYLDYGYEPRRNLRAIGVELMYDQVRLYPEILVYLRIRAMGVLHLIWANVLTAFCPTSRNRSDRSRMPARPRS